ncbi:hypothetical protein PROFUN_09770 [Planoprotostelium fungivorum]|uniref:Guanylate cyclase domain-containing protein n=1 Tax=Planoprotostelium fungivorum TaxID=1890364 RepID=A0A2P6NFC6_9EUKA|nr:hypothetical protein PROFUN_09770 [Planoprotostelium fungivorum]
MQGQQISEAVPLSFIPGVLSCVGADWGVCVSSYFHQSGALRVLPQSAIRNELARPTAYNIYLPLINSFRLFEIIIIDEIWFGSTEHLEPLRKARVPAKAIHKTAYSWRKTLCGGRSSPCHAKHTTTTQPPAMSLFANRSTMVLPLTVTQFASKSLSTASSRASTYRHRESSNIFRKVLSIRCVSVTCAVLFIILASAVISSTGYLTQRNLRSSQMYTQQQGVSLVSQLQINEILGYVDDSIAMLVPFVATHSMKPSVPPSEFELPHKAAYVEFINKLSAPRQETFFLMAYIWPTGKFLATEVIGGQWLIFESIIYNSTFSVYNVFPSIGPTTNVSAVDYTRPILRIPFEGDVGASLAGSHCNSSGSWLLTTLPGNPQTTLCKSVNDCDNGALSGVMLTVKTMLNQVLVVIGAPDAMAYIMEDNGDLVATSTGASPFDTVTGKRVNVNTTNLPWIAASAASYRRDPDGITTMNYGGIDYRMQGSAVKDHNNLEWIIVVMLPLPQDNYLRNSALICAGVCVCASILFVLIILYLTRSLFELSEELEKVSRLELDLNHLSEPPFLEASKLYKSFLMMHAALSSFSKYVPKEIIGHILTSRKEAVPYLKAATTTVYFQDIKGFTSLAEKLDPEVLATITAEYMEAMSSVIIEHGGVIDKYIGDCIMALFNLPSHLEEHENAACHAATECAQLLKQLNKRWKSLYDFELEQRIGINSGEVLAGNIGSSQRLAFTCIGDNVNLASRVENINKYYGTSILITESTWQKIDHEIFSSRKISTVKVEGKNIETSLYEITKESKPEKKELFKMYEDALSWYDSNQLQAAKCSLDHLLEKYSKDVPSQHLMDRIVKSMAGEWDRVETVDK